MWLFHLSTYKMEKKNEITGLKKILLVQPRKNTEFFIEGVGEGVADTEDIRNLCLILKIVL